MRIIISHDTYDNGLTLPINYHHILQSVIYAHMRGTVFQNIHEVAYAYGKRDYRMFTFSEIFGKYKIHERRITFYGRVSFKISSPDSELINSLILSFRENGIFYGTQKYEEIQIEVDDSNIEQTQANIHMISPICVYSTDNVTGRTIYYEPGTEQFRIRIEDNYIRKYMAFFDQKPKEVPTIRPVCVLAKHKKVTAYKEFMISAYMGEYMIVGSKESLNFWLNTGLGSKNAQGFGMFDLI